MTSDQTAAFLSKLSVDEALQKAANEATGAAGGDSEAALAALVEVGKTNGFEVTVEAMRSVLDAQVGAAGAEGALSDELLDAVAGGVWIYAHGDDGGALCIRKPTQNQ